MALLRITNAQRRASKIALLTLGLVFGLYYIFGSLSGSPKLNSTIAADRYMKDNYDPELIVITDGSNSKLKGIKNDNPSKDISQKLKATFVTLARNSDLWSLVESIAQVEDRFNNKFHYDWVFLNDEEFNEDFKKHTSRLVSGKTYYGVIPESQWSFPKWIDTERAAEVRQKMKEDNIIYGDSIPYRHMCRYESGFFFRHPLMQQYDYYWRVEPSIKLSCDINYDVFKYMQENNKEYGFTLSLEEYKATIPTLWETTKIFMKEHPEHVAKNNLMDWISDDGGVTYNGCHFWSNFEVGTLSFWRSEAYLAYFDYLDKAGGFFYERWGDAPIHSIAAALFMDRSKLHFFDDVGYYHPPYTHCPIDEGIRIKGRCSCNPNDDVTFKPYSCTSKFYDLNGLKKPSNWKDHS